MARWQWAAAGCMVALCLALYPAVEAGEETAPAPAALAAGEENGLLDEVEAMIEESSPEEEEVSPEEAALERLRLEKERLALERELKEEEQNRDMAEIILETKRLAIENERRQGQREKDMAALEGEKTRLDLEYESLLQKQRMKLVEREMLKNELALDQEVREAENRKALADLDAKKSRIEAENALREMENQRALAALQAETERVNQENQRQSALLETEKLKRGAEENEREAELARQSFEEARWSFEREKLRHERFRVEEALEALNLQLDLHEKKEEWKKRVEADIPYAADPLVAEGRLHLTDRRVDLDGPIFPGTAKYIAERIQFYNNQSEAQPIFLVIDDCPGGSVMEGYAIIKAMQSSAAPIHVVVKSFAASMGAVIVAMADHSYAFPNAIILHHQMYGITWGTQTQLAEELVFLKEWEKRIHGPVAEKMGLTVEQFVKKMYEHNSEGDWKEFADKARELKWVNTVIAEVREHGYTQKPEGEAPKPWWWWAQYKEERDERGKPFLRLPRLGPCDFYFLYNPDGYYHAP
ncbi:MAG: ATP-dependent Clp protease proteolytic subunit [Planctomycetota bacterium]